MRKIFIGFLTITAFALFSSVIYRALPIAHTRELCMEVCSGHTFRKSLRQPTPDWVKKQLDADSFPVEITAAKVDKLYREIREKIGQQILHYRILNNVLYKYIPNDAEYSSVDTSFERAFKTLLSYTKVPDLDFLLCPMDGIPEPYVPQDFFLASRIEDQVPILGQAKRKDAQYVMLIPDQFSLTESWKRDIAEIKRDNPFKPWEKKKEAAMWRGSLTDVGLPGDYSPDLKNCPRFKISQLSVQYPDQVNAGISQAESPKTITILSHEHLIRSAASKGDHLEYKYLPVLDGHMCTYPGYQWRLLSNSVALKQESDQIQWFYGALKPYEHYIPIKNDLSDLLSQIAWAKAHDEEVQQISKRAQEFARTHLMPGNQYVYLFKVLERYAALQKINFRTL